MADVFERAQRRLESERKQEVREDLEGVVGPMDAPPDGIAPETWNLIKENGHLATVRLNEILNSKRFHRLSASSQARLIQLAQDRAFGKPIAQKAVTKSLVITDATARALADQAQRAALPEYRRSAAHKAASASPETGDGPFPPERDLPI